MGQLEARFGDNLLIVSRHFPLSQHANAVDAARAAEAAGLQGEFDGMADLLFANQDFWKDLTDPKLVFELFELFADALDLNLDQFRADVDDLDLLNRIARDAAAAGTLQLPGTPSFFLNGDQISVPLILEEFETVIQAELDAVDEVFSLNRATGEVFVADSSALDFETMPAFSLMVDATNGATTTLNTTIQLTDANEASPDAVDDTYHVEQGGELAISSAQGVLANDSDADGDSLTANPMTLPVHGDVTLEGDGSFVYIPDVDFFGSDSFSYEADDGEFSSIATVMITVTPSSDSSGAVPDSYSFDEDEVLNIDPAGGLLANDNIGPGPFTVELLVSDRGDPSLSAIQSFNIVVNPPPIIDPIDDAPVGGNGAPASTGPLGFLPTFISNAFADTGSNQNNGNNGQTDGGQGGSSTQTASGSPQTSSSGGSTQGGAPNFQSGPDTGVAHITRTDADDGDEGDDGDGDGATDGDSNTDGEVRGQDGEPSDGTSTSENVPDEVSGTPRQGTTQITDSVISSYKHKTEDLVLDHLVGDRWEWSVDPAHWHTRPLTASGAAVAPAVRREAEAPAVHREAEAPAVRRPTAEHVGGARPSVAVAEADPARVAASEPVTRNNGESPGPSAGAAYVYLPLLVTDLSPNRAGGGKGLLRRWRERLRD